MPVEKYRDFKGGMRHEILIQVTYQQLQHRMFLHDTFLSKTESLPKPCLFPGY